MNFNVIRPDGDPVPVVVSVPHCGIFFPPELAIEFKPGLLADPDDTDWFVNQLYDFAPAMGITMITASISRWVIDLNREINAKPLYGDGRIITGLCPTTNFLGEPLYLDERPEVADVEKERRINLFYKPYHHQINDLLAQLLQKHNRVLLWDCHSIRQCVPTIRKEKFPDLILGDADGTSASPGLIETALLQLEKSPYSLSHNQPFKGGSITRHFGNPSNGIHALQLEMTKVNYMDDHEKVYSPQRAEKMRGLLKNVFEHLIDHLVG